MRPSLLSLINSEQSALAALESNDPGIRYHAAWWLGKHRVQNSVPALIRCLHDRRDETSTGGFPLRRQAARSLGLIKDKICVEELVKTLTESDDIQLHEASIRSLINLGSKECIAPLVSYFNSEVQGKPIESLIEAFTLFKAWSIKDKISPYLLDDSARIKGAASAYFYACTNDKAHLAQIFSLLSHDNPFARQSAAFDLARVATLEEGSSIQDANIPNNIKLHVIKEILSRSITSNIEERQTNPKPLSRQEIKWMAIMDQLVAETTNGNLLNQKHQMSPHPPEVSNEKQSLQDIIAKAIELLKSRSPSDREYGIHLLSALSSKDPAMILSLHQKETDQDVIMGLIKTMASTGCPEFSSVLMEAIGLEIANHCQGNIRRVAACGLGRIGSEMLEPFIRSQIVNKLTWTIVHPEDWGLRYSAATALEQIANHDARISLADAYKIENDFLVKERIRLALLKTTPVHTIQEQKLEAP
ncbi:MAG: HEAT repeat domain-containing protein [Synechococcus sp. TMED20]|nr:MAG: HEAT repeat domain-containing protein [Synechococcus sp. TMED20]